MNESVLVVERIVLESLSLGKLTKHQICSETGLNINLVSAILSNLFSMGIVNCSHGIYFIDKIKFEKISKEINSTENMKEEVKDLFVSMVNQYFSDLKIEDTNKNLSLKKVWLDPFEEKILNAHLFNLKEFIENVEKKRKYGGNNKKLYEKKVIMWGTSSYDGLVKTALQNIC